jgi:hypothetical protein
MKLNEMFPAHEEPDENKEVDWLGDLKFYIDSDHHILTNYLFPAIKRHEKHIDRSDAYKIYIKPIVKCYKKYCEKYKVDEPEKKFDKEGILQLAKQIADEQKKHIEDGDYEN